MIVRTGWPDAPVALLNAVRHHHERTDGCGYPDRLTELPLLTARVAVADVYDAVRTARSYQPARSAVEAQAILRKVALPPHVVEAVLLAAELLQDVWCEEQMDSGAA
ncbi:hypothetical protein GCM10008957_46710 [Deinococcus ruber]|uniref:HD-GYP domain-containing protein n=2 Tax=Deinococcus ruber TaxID=1848197 RepID=A0A918FDQ8_9DEIO|nr:hypothetical protein GCM10008957_46710 [Deinococcus ruber]